MQEKTRKCPHCGEIIDINATVCPFCAEDIPIEETSSSKTYCPYCGEEILPTAKKCKHCKNWLINNTNGHKYYNNSLITAFGIIGIIILISILFSIISGTGNYYTTDNWLRGCEQGKEYLGDFGIGVYRDYKCKNKSYTDVKEGSLTTLGLNSSFEVHENGNPVGYIHYDYNFHQYSCAYVWDQKEVSCNLSEFVSNLKQYEDYKKNKNTKEQKSATKSQDKSTKPTPPPTAKPLTYKTNHTPSNNLSNNGNNNSTQKVSSASDTVRDAVWKFINTEVGTNPNYGIDKKRFSQSPLTDDTFDEIYEYVKNRVNNYDIGAEIIKADVDDANGMTGEIFYNFYIKVKTSGEVIKLPIWTIRVQPNFVDLS